MPSCAAIFGTIDASTMLKMKNIYIIIYMFCRLLYSNSNLYFKQVGVGGNCYSLAIICCNLMLESWYTFALHNYLMFGLLQIATT